MSDKPVSVQAIAARGRELSESEWKLPPRYRLDPELLALPPEELQAKHPELFKRWQRVQEQQKAWAAQVNAPAGQPSVQDVHRAQAVQMAEELRVVIERLKEQRNAVITSGAEGDPVELQAAILALRQRRAESLSLIGRFDLAAQESSDPAFRDYCLAILDAIERDDGEICDCAPYRGSGEHSDLSVPKTYAKDSVWSVKHGQMVHLIACSGCGHLNATPKLPPHIQTMRAHRARAQQIAGDLEPARAAEALGRARHTTKQLLSK